MAISPAQAREIADERDDSKTIGEWSARAKAAIRSLADQVEALRASKERIHRRAQAAEAATLKL